MIEHERHISHPLPQGSLKSYVAGFCISILLTIAAFYSVTSHSFSWPVAVSIVILLAIVQLIIQMIFFLHVSTKTRYLWNLTALTFTTLVVFIIVIGTLWIMSNLDFRMTSLQNNDSYMLHQEGFQQTSR